MADDRDQKSDVSLTAGRERLVSSKIETVKMFHMGWQETEDRVW